MNNSQETVLVNKDSDEGQFTLLCDYGDIISSQATIVQNEFKNEFFLYRVVEPFPTFEEYCEGNDFDEGELIDVFMKWELAKLAQNKL
jgi:hypothetical protein